MHMTKALNANPISKFITTMNFLQRIAKRGNECTKQAMRIYMGQRLCDVFALNFVGPSYDIIKRSVEKMYEENMPKSLN